MRRLMEWLVPPVSKEPVLDTLKRKAVEAGLDPSFFDEIANLPPEPGSLGPGDPGRINISQRGER